MALASILCMIAMAAPEVSAQPRDADAWYTVSTRNFDLWTNAEPQRGAEIAQHLELFRSVFALRSPQIELRSAVPTTFVAFRDRRAYDPYKSHPDRGGAVTLGQFLIHPDRNFLVFDASARLGQGFNVIYHEFVHYLVAHNFANVPRWFHEGLAEYYSTFEVEGESVVVGKPVERHRRWLGYDGVSRQVNSLSHDFTLRAVLTGESGHHGQRAGGFYAMSWVLVHYLLSGDAERLDHLADFLIRLRDGGDPDLAFERAFGLRIDDLEETLRAYATQPPSLVVGRDREAGVFPVIRIALDQLPRVAQPVVRHAAAPDVLYRLGDLQLRLGRTTRAWHHFQKALDHQPDHSESLAGLAVLRDLESRFEEASILYDDALREGSSEPLSFLRYGRHLLAQTLPADQASQFVAGQLLVARRWPRGAELAKDPEAKAAAQLAERAREALAAAVRLDGDYAEARALFGMAHLVGDVDPVPGIRALEKARALLPDRQDFTLILLLLHLQNDAFDRAKRLVATDLASHPRPEVVLWAEEEVERARLLFEASKAFEEQRAEEGLEFLDQAVEVTSDQELRDRLARRLTELQRRYEGL